MVLCAIDVAEAQQSSRVVLAQKSTATQVEHSSAPAIEALRIQLFYERSGTLSANIAPPASFNAHNTMIGEGDAKEPANDLIVSAALSIKGDEANADGPLILAVKGKGGKVLAKRVFKGLFFKGGKLVKAVFVPDAACAGRLDVEASIGTETKRASLALECGE